MTRELLIGGWGEKEGIMMMKKVLDKIIFMCDLNEKTTITQTKTSV